MSINAKDPGKSPKPTAKCRQLSPKEKERLFNMYIVPNLADIKSLTKYYTANYQDVDDNYQHCLAQLYNYIGSYNPEQKLMTIRCTHPRAPPSLGGCSRTGVSTKTKNEVKNLSIGLILRCVRWRIYISMERVWFQKLNLGI